MSVVLFGAGGHARSVIAAMSWRDVHWSGLPGPVAPLGERLEDDEAAISLLLDQSNTTWHVAIGDNRRRQLVERLCREVGADRAAEAISPRARVDPTATVGIATAILEGAHVGPAARIGAGTILNTQCIVEHDVVVGDGSHVAPGATILGAAFVAEDAFVGAGAVVLPGIQVGTGAVVGAGSVVTSDVDSGARVAGNPARVLASS